MPKSRRQIPGIVNFVIFIVVALLLWQFLVPVLKIPSYLLPVPVSILQALSANLVILLTNSVPTLQEILFGFALSIVLGILLGSVLVYSKVIRDAIYPLLVIIASIPRIAIAPLIVIWFGFGLTSAVTIAFLVSFFPMVVNTMVGLANVPTDLVDLVHTMSRSSRKEFLSVRLPSSLPYMFAGMKASITLAAVGAIVAEFISSKEGLGYVLLVANSELRVPLLFSSLFMLIVLTLGLYLVILVAERLLTPWNRGAQLF